MKLNKKDFINHINSNFHFEKTPKISVAVSGGPDSMALIYLTKLWLEKINGNLIGLIVNHGLRKESKNEALEVKKILKDLKINSYILNVTKNKLVKHNMSEARDNRYSKMIHYCKKNKILHLFVAHHKDDNLETYLIRKISGSNIEGLFGMNDTTVKDKIQIVRPLLNVTKKQIYNFLKKENIKYLEDPSNLSEKYTRPIVRNFLKNNKISKEIDRDFKFIRNYQTSYRGMIWQKFNRLALSATRSKIVIELSSMKKENFLVFEKIINLVFKYFFGSKNYIRSTKIEILWNALHNKNFKMFNIKGLLIKKNDRLLIFSTKKV
mgnify:CR=1 FL=1